MDQEKTTAAHAYYRNGLLAWKGELQKELRLHMARYARMEKMHHPDKQDQGRVIDLTREFIQRIDREMEALNGTE